ncbi:MAG: hypothetical protein JXB32_01725 [Deltaproteobacteria bacterium]|nr:hypothetical protein [Deltaproteobacteria bacterium]
MKRARMIIVVASAVGIGVGLVAVGARSDDAVDADAGLPDPTSVEAEAQRRALATKAGIRVEDLSVRPSHPEGVTPEEFETSRRLRAESAGRELAVEAASTLQQRLEWAAEYADGQRRDRARRAVAGAEPSGAIAAAVEPASCRSFCELLLRCNGSVEPGDWDGCVAACGRSEFGSETRLRSVLALRDCEHL